MQNFALDGMKFDSNFLESHSYLKCFLFLSRISFGDSRMKITLEDSIYPNVW